MKDVEKWVSRRFTQTKAKLFDLMELIPIIELVYKNEMACGNIRVYKGATMWLISNFMRMSADAALT